MISHRFIKYFKEEIFLVIFDKYNFDLEAMRLINIYFNHLIYNIQIFEGGYGYETK